MSPHHRPFLNSLAETMTTSHSLPLSTHPCFSTAPTSAEKGSFVYLLSPWEPESKDLDSCSHFKSVIVSTHNWCEWSHYYRGPCIILFFNSYSDLWSKFMYPKPRKVKTLSKVMNCQTGLPASKVWALLSKDCWPVQRREKSQDIYTNSTSLGKMSCSWGFCSELPQED
jgi:hypothetical protein